MNMPTSQSDAVLSFPHGLIGYEDVNEFQLFSPESDNPNVFELQAVKDETLALSVVAPESLELELNIHLSDEEQALLELTDPQDAVVALIVYKPVAGDVALPMKAIVKAPIIINSKTGLAMQKQLGEADTVQ